ncbi:LOW QUALITY PROTEIN: DNA-binding protein, partial [Streptomyces griseoflavus Tu4000]
MAGRRDGIRRTPPAAGERAEWARELLDHLRPAGRDVRGVVDWLAATVDAEVSLRDAAGALLAGTRLPLDESLVAGLAGGRIASAAWEGEGRHVRLAAIGHPARTCVLAVSRESPFDRHASDVVTHTAQVIELLLTADETAAAGHLLRRATADLRLAILQLLMVEDTVAARRVAAGLWPGLLDADTACVYVVESAPALRDRLAAECLDSTREEALVVRCPAMDGHVIVVSPREATAGALRSLVERHPGTFLGGSVWQSLARTATAYKTGRQRPGGGALPGRQDGRVRRTHPSRAADGPGRAARLGGPGAESARRAAAPHPRRAPRHHPPRPGVHRRQHRQDPRRQPQHRTRPHGARGVPARRRLRRRHRPCRGPPGAAHPDQPPGRADGRRSRRARAGSRRSAGRPRRRRLGTGPAGAAGPGHPQPTPHPVHLDRRRRQRRTGRADPGSARPDRPRARAQRRTGPGTPAAGRRDRPVRGRPRPSRGGRPGAARAHGRV